MTSIPSKAPGKPDRNKPVVIDSYNHAMGGVDKADQLAIYYCFQRKSIKWWKKVFFWLLETSVVNCYILYKEHKNNKCDSQLSFRRKLIKGLISHLDPSERPRRGRRRIVDGVERLQPGKHFLAKGSKRDCAVCSERGSGGPRHMTVYFCQTCSEHPPLHPEKCFEYYHTSKSLKRPRNP